MRSMGSGKAGKTACYWKGTWQRLDEMRHTWELCDVTLYSEDEHMFMAHSPMLAASSRAFHSFFVNSVFGRIEQRGEKKLVLRGVKGEILQVTLDFIYGKLPSSIQEFQKLQEGTILLEIEGAGSYCDQRIRELSVAANNEATEEAGVFCPVTKLRYGAAREGTKATDHVKKPVTLNDADISLKAKNKVDYNDSVPEGHIEDSQEKGTARCFVNKCDKAKLLSSDVRHDSDITRSMTKMTREKAPEGNGEQKLTNHIKTPGMKKRSLMQIYLDEEGTVPLTQYVEPGEDSGVHEKSSPTSPKRKNMWTVEKDKHNKEALQPHIEVEEFTENRAAHKSYSGDGKHCPSIENDKEKEIDTVLQDTEFDLLSCAEKFSINYGCKEAPLNENTSGETKKLKYHRKLPGDAEDGAILRLYNDSSSLKEAACNSACPHLKKIWKERCLAQEREAALVNSSPSESNEKPIVENNPDKSSESVLPLELDQPKIGDREIRMKNVDVRPLDVIQPSGTEFPEEATEMLPDDTASVSPQSLIDSHHSPPSPITVDENYLTSPGGYMLQHSIEEKDAEVSCENEKAFSPPMSSLLVSPATPPVSLWSPLNAGVAMAAGDSNQTCHKSTPKMTSHNDTRQECGGKSSNFSTAKIDSIEMIATPSVSPDNTADQPSTRSIEYDPALKQIRSSPSLPSPQYKSSLQEESTLLVPPSTVLVCQTPSTCIMQDAIQPAVGYTLNASAMENNVCGTQESYIQPQSLVKDVALSCEREFSANSFNTDFSSSSSAEMTSPAPVHGHFLNVQSQRLPSSWIDTSQHHFQPAVSQTSQYLDQTANNSIFHTSVSRKLPGNPTEQSYQNFNNQHTHNLGTSASSPAIYDYNSVAQNTFSGVDVPNRGAESNYHNIPVGPGSFSEESDIDVEQLSSAEDSEEDADNAPYVDIGQYPGMHDYKSDGPPETSSVPHLSNGGMAGHDQRSSFKQGVINIAPQVKYESKNDTDWQCDIQNNNGGSIMTPSANSKMLPVIKRSGIHRHFCCPFEGCGYSNRQMGYLQSHAYHRHGLGAPTKLCPHCSRAYFSSSQLNSHVRRTHEKARPPAAGVKCDDCDESMASVYKLQTHQLKVHGKGKLFTCDHCTFRSPRKKDVQAHTLSQHGKSPAGVRIYSCQYCSYKCIDRNRYEEHEAMHTGEQKFRCESCGKSYTTRRGLRTHMKYHSDDRPHECHLCDARFKVRSKLKDHIRLVHTQPGLKPFKCGYCDHTTALRGNCNQHIRKHHPGLEVCVVDQMASSRKVVKDYDYAGLQGDGIEECNDICAARWAAVGANTLSSTENGVGHISGGDNNLESMEISGVFLDNQPLQGNLGKTQSVIPAQ